MSEHIVAVFASENDANTAARDLEAAGIPASSIRHYKPQSITTDSSVRGAAEPTAASGGGFWAWLLGEEPSSRWSPGGGADCAGPNCCHEAFLQLPELIRAGSGETRAICRHG